jgi:pimeloyl-ACP methyl ester carboxylesterase
LRLGILILIIGLSGCAHRGPADPYSGWNAKSRATAEETWLYAQLSNNAYGHEKDSDVFALPAGVGVAECVLKPFYGFAYTVFIDRRAGHEPQAIIAFRGTNFTEAADWWHGNLLGTQNLLGLGVFDVWRERLGEQARITVTGHSLGGGIATHISLNRPNVRSFAFNGSPVFWREGGDRANARRSVVEFGEILALLRAPGSEATQIYTSLGCTTGRNAITQHSSSRLANCLTLIAAYADGEAWDSIAVNGIPWPRGWTPQAERPEATTDASIAVRARPPSIAPVDPADACPKSREWRSPAPG